MTALPVVSGKQCVSALVRLGYTISRTKGSHIRLTCDGRSPVTVPNHAELDRGTLRSILRTVKINSDEFIRLIK